MNVLDLNGLTRLVNNIKNMFATKTELATKQDTLTNMTASEATTGTATTARTITAKVLNDKIDEKIAEVDTGVMSVTSSTNGKILVDGASVTAYTHPTTAGNKHIPTGGSSGQVLKYGGSSGTATWSDETTYSNFVGSGSSAAAGLVPSPGTTAGTTKYLREDGSWEVPPDTVYTHPTTSGNKHIPSGGSSGKILKWSADGTATWETEYSYTHPTTSGNKHIPSGGSSGQILKYSSDGTAIWADEYSYTHPTSAGNKHIPTGGSSGQILKYGGSSGTASWGTLTASDIGAAPSDINTGVMSVSEGSTDGTISVDGTDVSVHGLGTGAYAAAYTHPTTAGNKHIPTGGSSGQVLVYGGSSGTASWTTLTASDVGAAASDINTGVMSVTAGSTNGKISVDGTDVTAYTHPTTAGNKHIPSGGSTGQILKYSAAGTATWANEYSYTHPSDGANTGNFGPSADASPDHSGTFSVPYFTVNSAGHVTAASTKTITLPAQYTHPTTAGNKHIPSGGSTGQFLKYSSSGTAAWSSITTSNITDFPTIPTITDTYDGTSSNGMSGKAVKSAIDSALTSAYKPSGSVAYASLPTLSASVMGNVYNVSDSFTIDNRFVEYDSGTTKTFPAGSEVAVINTGTTNSPTYKFSVMSGFIDLSGYQLANTAVTHTQNTAAGSSTKPVYINSSGVATAVTYELNADVPSDAVFTDTVYTHPTTSGNKHIPSGGSSGQILKWSSNGTATWAAEYSYTHPTTAGNKHIPSGGSTGQILVYGGSSGTASWSNPTTYSDFVGSGSSAAAGLVPSPGTTAGTTKYLREDGIWEVPPDTIYTHPTTSGNKHIPSGGSSGKILKWSSDGTATWETEYSYTHPTTSGNKHIPSGGSSGQILKWSADGTATWAAEYSYTHPTTAGNKHIPSGGSSGQVLVYGGSSGTASWGSITAIVISDDTTMPNSVANGGVWYQLTGDSSITNGEQEQF